MQPRASLLLVAAGSSLAGLANAAGREWTLERQGVTFELTAADLRAWKGPRAGAPAFSMKAILAADVRELEAYADQLARELAADPAREYPDYTMSHNLSADVLSIVGTLVSYQQSGGGDTPGTAHPSGYEVVRVRDVLDPAATPSLLDFYSEKQILAALKADPWIRTFADPEKGFERAASLKDLVESLDPEWAMANPPGTGGDCSLDVSFDVELVHRFSFHHLEKDRVAIRIAIAPGTEMANRMCGLQQVGLLLPIPDALRQDLARADRGTAGFLTRNRKAAGSPSFADGMEVDIQELARKHKPPPDR